MTSVLDPETGRPLRGPVSTVPPFLDAAVRPGPIHQVTPEAVLVDFPGIARILVRDGVVVGIDAESTCNPDDLAWLLDGHIAPIAALQRGEIALRASAVVIDGSAVAVCGRGAVGASAIAAGLASRGHAVIADGWLPISSSTLHAHAVTDELALWPDVAELVGLDPEGGRAVRDGLAKRRHRFATGTTSPLAAVVVIERHDWQDSLDAERSVGGSTLERLYPLVAMNHLVEPMGREPDRFWWATAVAAGAAVHSIELDKGRAGVAEPARAIEDLVQR